MFPTLTDNALLSALIRETETGNTLYGGYKEVLFYLFPEVRFSHFRALQLSRVGRKWENVYETRFTTLAPNLPETASSWCGR